jgi:hypothetical protein
VQVSFAARVYLLDMAKVTRAVGSGSSLKASQRRRYQLLLSGSAADSRELVSDYSLDLGDHVLAAGAPYKGDRPDLERGTADEALLCRRSAPRESSTDRVSGVSSTHSGMVSFRSVVAKQLVLRCFLLVWGRRTQKGCAGRSLAVSRATRLVTAGLATGEGRPCHGLVSSDRRTGAAAPRRSSGREDRRAEA